MSGTRVMGRAAPVPTSVSSPGLGRSALLRQVYLRSQNLAVPRFPQRQRVRGRFRQQDANEFGDTEWVLLTDDGHETELVLSRRKQGFESLGNANKSNTYYKIGQLVSNNCPINGHGQAWTLMTMPLRAAPAIAKDLHGAAVCEQISDTRPRRNSNAAHLRRFSWQES
jgi:hypothetical protein